MPTNHFWNGSALFLIPVQNEGPARPTDEYYDCKQFDGEARPRVIYFGTSRRQIVCPYVRIATEDSEVTSYMTVLHRRRRRDSTCLSSLDQIASSLFRLPPLLFSDPSAVSFSTFKCVHVSTRDDMHAWSKTRRRWRRRRDLLQQRVSLGSPVDSIRKRAFSRNLPFFRFRPFRKYVWGNTCDENSKIFEISRDEKGGDNGYTRFILGDGHLPKEKELIIKWENSVFCYNKTSKLFRQTGAKQNLNPSFVQETFIVKSSLRSSCKII